MGPGGRWEGEFEEPSPGGLSAEADSLNFRSTASGLFGPRLLEVEGELEVLEGVLQRAVVVLLEELGEEEAEAEAAVGQ